MPLKECESRERVAVIGDERQLRSRVASVLSSIKYRSQEFVTITEEDLSPTQFYAVVVITNNLNQIVPNLLAKLDKFERIILVSQTEIESEVVNALDSGARFVFDISEADSLLSVRLQAALRSHGEKVQANIFAPPFKFDSESRRVYLANKALALSPMEYLFAEYMFSRPGTIVSKSDLMLSVWSLSPEVDARRVDTAACRVRKKMLLGSHQSGWKLQSWRNAGYRLCLMKPEHNTAGV